MMEGTILRKRYDEGNYIKKFNNLKTTIPVNYFIKFPIIYEFFHRAISVLESH